MRDTLSELIARYLKHFPAETERHAALRMQLDVDGDRILSRANMNGHITCSALVMNPSRDRVLLIHHRAYDKWLLPGGHYEAPHPLWHSACREVAEETGVSKLIPLPGWPPLLPLDIDTHPIGARPTKQEGEHRHHDFAFAAMATDDAALTPQLEEVHAARWMSVLEAAELPSRRMQRLLAKLQIIDTKRAQIGQV